jgi:hypothetical protein
MSNLAIFTASFVVTYCVAYPFWTWFLERFCSRQLDAIFDWLERHLP